MEDKTGSRIHCVNRRSERVVRINGVTPRRQRQTRIGGKRDRVSAEDIVVGSHVRRAAERNLLLNRRQVVRGHHPIAIRLTEDHKHIRVVGCDDADRNAAARSVPERLVHPFQIEQCLVQRRVWMRRRVRSKRYQVLVEKREAFVQPRLLSAVHERHAVEGRGNDGEQFRSVAEQFTRRTVPGVFVVVRREVHPIVPRVLRLFRRDVSAEV